MNELLVVIVVILTRGRAMAFVKIFESRKRYLASTTTLA